MNANEILDREFLEIRAKILEVAASLDRLDRAEGDLSDDRRLDLIAQGFAILASDEVGRAEQVQMLFSRAYDPNWQKDFEVSAN